MTAHEILSELRSLGGRLEARGDRLHIEAPAGAVTPELKARLSDRKAELLAMLQADDDARSRMERHGISIAIDKESGRAHFVFTKSDEDRVRHCAHIRQPFDIGVLAPDQRRELLDSLNYYETLIARREVQP